MLPNILLHSGITLGDSLSSWASVQGRMSLIYKHRRPVFVLAHNSKYWPKVIFGLSAVSVEDHCTRNRRKMELLKVAFLV